MKKVKEILLNVYNVLEFIFYCMVQAVKVIVALVAAALLIFCLYDLYIIFEKYHITKGWSIVTSLLPVIGYGIIYVIIGSVVALVLYGIYIIAKIIAVTIDTRNPICEKVICFFFHLTVTKKKRNEMARMVGFDSYEDMKNCDKIMGKGPNI